MNAIIKLNNGGLIPYEEAKNWLSQAEAIDDVLQLADKSAALEVYAKRAMDFDMEQQAARIRIRAERRAGELLKPMERGAGGDRKSEVVKNQILKHEKFDSEPSQYAKAKADSGITDMQAHRFQKLADVPHGAFEEAIEKEGVKPTAAGILRANPPIVADFQKAQEAKAGRERFFNEPVPKLDSKILMLWGQLERWERDGTYRMDAAAFHAAPDHMRQSLLKFAPVAIGFLTKLTEELKP